MSDSYEKRIAAAEAELASAKVERDKHYPGSLQWEDADVAARNWERTLERLRAEREGIELP